MNGQFSQPTRSQLAANSQQQIGSQLTKITVEIA
jgi:hypothetical protein